MNDFSQLLVQAASEIRALPNPKGAAFEPIALQMEQAATITSGIALQNLVFEIAKTITTSHIFELDSVPSFKQVLEILKQRWQRANSCCRR